MTRRQLLAVAAAAPAAAAVTRAAPALPSYAMAVQPDLEAILYRQMTPFARYQALQQSLALGLISPSLARQALDLDLPAS